MTMTAAMLIKKLQKMPPRAHVVFCAHDQDPERGEFDGEVRSVEEAPEPIRKRGYGVVLQG